MRVIFKEDAKISYDYEEEIGRLYGSMGNVETGSNGRRGGEEPEELVVTMRILQREVYIYIWMIMRR
jgi:hypothetical protein